MQNLLLVSLLAVAAVAAPASEAKGEIQARQPGTPQSTIVICTDSFRRGECKTWSQQGHCWDMNDAFLAPFNDRISSAYPSTPNIVWTLWEHVGCKGAQAHVIAPGVDDLNSIGFNDKTSAFSWSVA